MITAISKFIHRDVLIDMAFSFFVWLVR